MRVKKIDFILLLILLSVAAIFRLVRLSDFQYWSDDEQLLWFIVRHIVIDHHPSLTTPNVATGAGLGPLFHFLVSPWFAFVNFQPERIILLGNLFTLLSLVAIYYCGKLIGGRFTGFSASFLYAVSFMSSLFDRRLWALSPNVFLSTLGIIGLIKIIRGESKYIYFLIPAAIFSVNSDPSLGFFLLTCLFTFLILRPKLEIKHLFLAFIISTILLSPLIIFELRHGGQNLKSIQLFITQQKNIIEFSDIKEGNFLLLQLENFSRFIYINPTKSADAYFCYCPLYDGQSSLLITALAVSFLLFTFSSFRSHSKINFLLIVILISYLAGILIFKTILKGNPAFFYSLTISPVVFLIVSSVISKNKLLAMLVLAAALIFNLHSFLNSEFRFPLRDRITLAKTLQPNLANLDFSLYYYGDILVAGGGFTSIFYANELKPTKGSLSEHWGHVYKSYNLYPLNFHDQEPGTVAQITNKETLPDENQKIIGKLTEGNLKATIYDNSSHWFNPNMASVLYQPEYFK